MLSHLAMFESPVQWMILLAIILLLFGGSRIPEMMKGLGSGVKEFKKGLNEEEPAEKKDVEAKK